MLESMIENPQPARAEASDVANAIWDGTDAVMLSAESAVGKHPLEAIHYLDRIAADADEHYEPRISLLAETLEENLTGRTDVSVAFSACRTAKEIGAKLIVVFTEGGGSARLVSRLAADIPVIGATTDIENARRMRLLRGVESLLITRAKHFSEMLASMRPLLKKRYGLQSGDRVVMTLGHPLWTTGTTNMMRVETF
jgi:pyruvate kinase